MAKFVTPARLQTASRFMADVFLATLAAMVFTLPIIAYHFGQVSVASLPANFLILPAQPGVMTWGGLSTLVGLVWPWAGQVLAWVAWLFLAYSTSLVELFNRMPGAALTVTLSEVGLLLSYTFVFGLTWLAFQPAEKRAALGDRLRSRLSTRSQLPLGSVLSLGLILCILLILWWRSQPDGRLHVTFFNAGNGEGTLIQTPSGRTILVDGGDNPIALNDQLGRHMPFWRQQIDLIMATHPDEEHLAALPDIVDRYQVGQIITNGQLPTELGYTALLAAAGERITPIHRGQAGEVIAIGDGVNLELLWPAGDLNPQDNDNNSLVVRLVFGDFSLLLMGNAGVKTEQALINGKHPLAATVLKPGIHWGDEELAPEFLAAVQPQFIISTDSPDWTIALADQAAAAGVELLHVESLGTIEVTTDGRQMWWETGE